MLFCRGINSSYKHFPLLQATVSLDCDQATMVTQHGKPMFTKVFNILLITYSHLTRCTRRVV